MLESGHGKGPFIDDIQQINSICFDTFFFCKTDFRILIYIS